MKPTSMSTLRRVRRLALLTGLLLASGQAMLVASAADDDVLIRNAMVFDGTGRAPYAASVLVQGGRIAAIGADLKAPTHTRQVDAKGQALLPGLFDLHTHWTPNAQPSTLPQIANRYLAAGVTTVSDFHQPPEAYAPRRAWLHSIAAPDVKFAARMSTPLGHGADWGDENTTRWVNSPAAATAAVKQVAAYKPDFIKAFTDGWRYSNAADNSSMDEETLAALVAEAHRQQLRVFTHTVMVKRGKTAAAGRRGCIGAQRAGRPGRCRTDRVDEGTRHALLALVGGVSARARGWQRQGTRGQRGLPPARGELRQRAAQRKDPA